MLHIIQNQDGNYIEDELIRDEIDYALEHDMTYTYFDGHKIDIDSDKKTEAEHFTIVTVEYPERVEDV